MGALCDRGRERVLAQVPAAGDQLRLHVGAATGQLVLASGPLMVDMRVSVLVQSRTIEIKRDRSRILRRCGRQFCDEPVGVGRLRCQHPDRAQEPPVVRYGGLLVLCALREGPMTEGTPARWMSIVVL